MANGSMTEVIRRLRAAGLSRGAGLSDAELLAAYASGRDGSALEALVYRHGPMVWGAVRRALGDGHDAEDAFQATFLVLVRKAASVGSPDRLAGWLYGVAVQTARKARATAARRRARERAVAALPDVAEITTGDANEMQALLDEELVRLPEKYRAAVLLCDVQGKTRREAAGQLGAPEGTVAAWVARGRALLAKRLARRGLAPGAAPAALAPPAALVRSTLDAALSAEVLRAMCSTKLKLATAALAGLAVALLVGAPHSGTAPPTPRLAAAPVPKDKPLPDAGWREAFAVKHDHAISAVAASGSRLAAGDAGGNVYLYDAKTGKDRLRVLFGGRNFTSVERLHLQPDGKQLWSVVNGRKSLWQTDLTKAKTPTCGAFGNLGVSTNGEWWVESHDPKVLCVRPNLNHLDTKPGRHHDYEDAVRFKVKVVDAVFSPDGRWLAALTDDGQLRVYAWEPDRDLKKPPQSTLVLKEKVSTFAFSNDGKQLAFVGGDFAGLYDPKTGKPTAALKGHRGAVRAVAFSPDGQTLVTGSDDKTLRAWRKK